MQRVILGVIGALAFTAPAQADWQFTKWGMTEAQVLRASHDQAVHLSLSDSKGNSIPGETTTLSMPYVSGNLKMTAQFRFDAADKLCRVVLNDADAAEAPLVAKYGPPDVAINGVLKWYRDGDQIMFIRSLGAIDYSPRVTENNRGL